MAVFLSSKRSQTTTMYNITCLRAVLTLQRVVSIFLPNENVHGPFFKIAGQVLAVFLANTDQFPAKENGEHNIIFLSIKKWQILNTAHFNYRLPHKTQSRTEKV